MAANQRYPPYPRGLPRGMVNTGNHCYLNSAIQILYHVPAIRNLFLRYVPEPTLGRPPTDAQALRIALHSVFTELNRNAYVGPLGPRGSHVTIPKLLFPQAYNMPQDIREAIERIINVLEPQISREFCVNFAENLPTETQFWNLFANTNANIYTIFTHNSPIIGTPECIMIDVVHPHDVPAANLETFYPPLVLDLRPHLLEKRNDPGPYDVWGVAVHGGGHYWVYVKKDNRWFRCNDAECTEHRGALEEALRADKCLHGGNAVMLVYKRRGTADDWRNVTQYDLRQPYDRFQPPGQQGGPTPPPPVGPPPPPLSPHPFTINIPPCIPSATAPPGPPPPPSPLPVWAGFSQLPTTPVDPNAPYKKVQECDCAVCKPQHPPPVPELFGPPTPSWTTQPTSGGGGGGGGPGRTGGNPQTIGNHNLMLDHGHSNIFDRLRRTLGLSRNYPYAEADE